jgi:hypothetical protein
MEVFFYTQPLTPHSTLTFRGKMDLKILKKQHSEPVTFYIKTQNKNTKIRSGNSRLHTLYP